MKKQDLMAFAIALMVMFGISFAATAFVPSAKANQTSQSETKSALTDTVVADFSTSNEVRNQATKFNPARFQSVAEQSPFSIAKGNERFQINYSDFTTTTSGKFTESPPVIPALDKRFEIINNWQNCKSEGYFFLNDYKPELVWRE